MALGYFTLTELRALPDMGDAVKYPDARLTAAGEWVEAVIERVVTASFVARPVTETVDGNSQDCDGGLLLSARYVLDVTAVTSNGVVFDAGQLAEITVRSSRVMGARVYRRTVGEYTGFIAWDAGTRNIQVTYDAGFSGTPPADVKEAALQGARDRVLRTAGTGVSDRTTSITNDAGTLVLAAPGEKRPTGLPEVDAVIVGWAKKLRIRWSVG